MKTFHQTSPLKKVERLFQSRVGVTVDILSARYLHSYRDCLNLQDGESVVAKQQ